MSGRGSVAFVLCPALELPELVLDGHLPLGRPPLHIAVLQDQLPPLFQDDYAGAEEEEAEARGEHTLQEKYGERWAHPRASVPAPPGPGCCPAYGLGHEEVFL